MTFYWLGACAVFATFGAVNLAVSAVLGLAWPLVRARLEALPARSRARRLLALRLAPVALGALASASVALPSYLEFEPRNTAEIPGRILTALAATGFVLALLAAGRVVRANARTRRVLREWSRTATPVTLAGVSLPVSRIGAPLPIVALTGWRRPRLIVSARVLDGFENRLLLAMAAHESGHRNSADNLCRLLLAAGADPLLACRPGREMIAAWEEASEEAADDHAVASGTDPADLAEALVSVARLASPVWPSLPRAAFYRGGGIDRRVRRLLEMPAPSGRCASPPRRRRALGALLLSAAVLLAAESLHRPVYRLLERAVTSPHAQLRALVVDRPHA